MNDSLALNLNIKIRVKIKLRYKDVKPEFVESFKPHHAFKILRPMAIRPERISQSYIYLHTPSQCKTVDCVQSDDLGNKSPSYISYKTFSST